MALSSILIINILLVGFHLYVVRTMTTAVPEAEVKNVPDRRDFVPNNNLAPSAVFTEREIDELLYWHNLARSSVSPAASNMEYMNWDPYLQGIAQRWAEQCKWLHGQPVDIEETYGQNLWAISGFAPVTVKDVMSYWVDEKNVYNYTTNHCKKGKVCGHYTQVIWSTTTTIGCGKALCSNLEGAAKNMWMVVCQYSPVGNTIGQKPYKSGPACSQCSSGMGHCYNTMCRSCNEHNGECDCRQLCQNCGTVDETSCTCQCPPGYFGSDCSEICRNLHPYCGRRPGFPSKQFCHYHPMIPKLCPLMCGACPTPDIDLTCEDTTTRLSTTEKKSTTTILPDTETSNVGTSKITDASSNNENYLQKY